MYPPSTSSPTSRTSRLFTILAGAMYTSFQQSRSHDDLLDAVEYPRKYYQLPVGIHNSQQLNPVSLPSFSSNVMSPNRMKAFT